MQISNADFIRAASLAGSIVARRNSIPVLEHLLVRNGAGISFTGTDLDTQIEASVGGPAFDPVGTLPAWRNLVSMARATGADLDLSWEADKGVLVRSGEAEAQIRGQLPADDFPKMSRAADQVDWKATTGTDFLAAMRRVEPAISDEETRYYLNGIYIEPVPDSEWSYYLVATNGHVLHRARVELPDASGTLNPVIVPKRVVRTLLQMAPKIGNAAVRVGAISDTGFRVGTSVGMVEVVINAKTIMGTFPDYRRVMPKLENRKTLLLELADLKRAIATVTSLSSERTRAVKLTVTGETVKAEVSSPETGTASVSIPHQGTARSGLVGFNAKYLDAIAAACGGTQIKLSFDASSDSIEPALPVHITGPEDASFEAVLMPMRL